MKHSYLTLTDQFCGAGGSSQGARRLSQRLSGGLEVSLAMNHWKLAIETHNTNFPDTEHDCADISASDPRRYRSTDILITSPECTNHTLAKGTKRKYQQTNTLFGKLTVDPSAERSRATMWDVPRFAEYHNYNLIIVENVVEARQWIMWDAWLHAMSNLGYNHKCVYLNSRHALPTPQSRDRMYIVFWKKGNKAPDLEYRPKAYCQHCSQEVESIQSWKNPRRMFGKYNQQYVYRCPRCANVVEPYYYAAFNIIDWSIPGERIGDRKKELAEKTMARINYGLDKYKESQFIIYLDHSQVMHTSGISTPLHTQTTTAVAAIITTRYTSGIECRVKAINEAIGTQPGDVSHAVFGIPIGMTELNRTGKVRGMDETLSTVLSKGNHHGLLSMPLMVSTEYGKTARSQAKSVLEAMKTQTTTNGIAIVQPPFIIENRGRSFAKEIDKPLGALTTKITHGILSNDAVNAFLSYYYNKPQASELHEPTDTIPTRDRVALVLRPTGKVNVEDCTYRMLKPHEIQAAMAFERDYVVCGNSRDKVKQLGNAVTPPAMEWLLERGIETFM